MEEQGKEIREQGTGTGKPESGSSSPQVPDAIRSAINPNQAAVIEENGAQPAPLDRAPLAYENSDF